jgi:hypothetical protein
MGSQVFCIEFFLEGNIPTHPGPSEGEGGGDCLGQRRSSVGRDGELDDALGSVVGASLR